MLDTASNKYDNLISHGQNNYIIESFVERGGKGVWLFFKIELLIWRSAVQFPHAITSANLDFPPLCITSSIIKGQLLLYDFYTV